MAGLGTKWLASLAALASLALPVTFLVLLVLSMVGCGSTGPAGESGAGTAGPAPAAKTPSPGAPARPSELPPGLDAAAPKTSSQASAQSMPQSPPQSPSQSSPQSSPQSIPPGSPGTTPGASLIDPAALQALERMGAYLRLLEKFEVQADTSTDQVVDPGLKVQLDGKARLQVRRPDRLRLSVSSDRKQRELYFDGKDFTLVAPRLKFYAVTPAPPTLGGLYDSLRQHDIELPLADLFLWGASRSPRESVTLAFSLGPETVDGVQTEHYLIGEKDVSWQVWIQKGQQPLPRKLVITTLSVPQQPQHVALLRWNTAPTLDERRFVYRPAADAVRIRQTPTANPR